MGRRLLTPLEPRAAVRLAVVACGVRLVWVLATARPPGGLSDPLLYQRFAQGIARGDGYVSFNGLPTAYYPPGYPVFLGVIQWVLDGVGASGSLHWAAGVIQALLGGVTAVAVAVAAARWFDTRVGVVAGSVVAVWPNVIAYTSTLLSESLFLPLVSLFLATLAGIHLGSPAEADDHRATRTDAADTATGAAHNGSLPWWRRASVAAVLLGSTALVRPQVLVAVPAIVVAGVVAPRWHEGLRAALRVAAVLVAGVAVVIAPWFVRNLVVMDAPIAVSTNGGDNLCVGFHEGAPGHFVVPRACDTGEFYIDGPDAEVRRDAETSRRARAWAADHLGSLPALSARKIWYTYEADTDGLRAVEAYEQNPFLPGRLRGSLRSISTAAYLVILVAFAVGCGVLIRRLSVARRQTAGGAAALVLALCWSAMLVPVLVFGDGRFKVPASPMIAVVAAVGAVETWDAVRRRRAQRGAPDEPAAAAAASRASAASPRRAASAAASTSGAIQSAS